MNNTAKENSHLTVFPWSYEAPENYEKADLYVWCRNCNHDTRIESPSMQGIEGGVNIDPLTTNNKSSLALACEHCGSQLVLHFRKAEEGESEDKSEEAVEDAEMVSPNTEPSDETPEEVTETK